MADTVAGFACHRAPISGGSIQIRHKPGLPLRAISRRPGDDDLAGIPGHLKALEWNRQTHSPRFHVGLFSCPEAKQGPVALLSFKFREEFALSRGEYSSCNVEEIGQFPDLLDIDADFSALRKSPCNQTAGMAHAEAQIGAVGRIQAGLT